MKILGFASALTDIIAHVPEDFLLHIRGDKGGTVWIDDDECTDLIAKLTAYPTKSAAGGAAANTVCAMAQLGMQASLLAMIGYDTIGDTYVKSLTECGVDTSLVHKTHAAASGVCYSLITPDSDRTMRTMMGASRLLTCDDIRKVDFTQFSHFYIDGYQLYDADVFLTSLKLASAAKCKVCLDLASPEIATQHKDLLTNALLQYVDIAFANANEAMAVTNTTNIPDAINKLRQLCATVIVKDGANGASVATQNDFFQVPAIPVQHILDTTGAGDHWAAGFLYGNMSNWTPLQSAQFASQVAAEIIQTEGAKLSSVSIQKLKRLL